MTEFHKSVTDVLDCQTTHPIWVLPGGARLDLRKKQSKADLNRLAQVNAPFSLKEGAANTSTSKAKGGDGDSGSTSSKAK